MPPRPGIDPSDVMTIPAIAADLGVPESTVRTWISRYKVPVLGVIDGQKRFDFRDLAAIEARMARRHRTAA